MVGVLADCHIYLASIRKNWGQTIYLVGYRGSPVHDFWINVSSHRYGVVGHFSGGLASDHRADAAKYAVTAENTSFTLTSTNGGTSGLYSAKHYQEKAKEWATDDGSYAQVTNDSGANTGEYSAKAWASKPSGTVDGATASAKVSATNAAASAATAQATSIAMAIALG